MGKPVEVTPEPGVYPGIPFGTYTSWDAINSSRLNILAYGSPYHFHEDPGFEGSRSTEVGRLYHCLVLTPHLFPQEYALQERCQGRTKSKSQCKKKGQGSYGGKQFCSHHTPEGEEPDPFVIASQSVWDDAHRMMDSTLSYGPAQEILEGSIRETGYVWVEETSGLLCKALVDVDNEEADILADLKSAKDISEWGFKRAINSHGYHRQLAFYQNGGISHGRRRENLKWIAQENHAPWDVAIHEPHPDKVAVAARQLYEYLQEIAKCKAEGEWPGIGGKGPIVHEPSEWEVIQYLN